MYPLHVLLLLCFADKVELIIIVEAALSLLQQQLFVWASFKIYKEEWECRMVW